MKISCLNNKKIALLGFGVTGQEVYSALKSSYQITILNDQPVDGYQTYTYEQAVALGLEFDVIIKSPGIAYSHPCLQNTSAEIINDIELSYLLIEEYKLETKIVAITGTNGKTTTTQFICDVLNRAGRTAATCGNIGKSPLLVLTQNLHVDYLVMELSSYQLKQVNKFHPNFGLFLNISPDHIDYHGDFEDYINSKCNLFKQMTSSDCLVLNPELITEYPAVNWPSFASYGVSEDCLTAVVTSSMPKANYRLIFDLLERLGIDSQFIIKQINNFKGLEHRLEVVDCSYPFTVINDSKATNVNATNAAISNLTAPATLIVGGSIKVEDYTLLDYQNSNLKNIIAYGVASEKFAFIPGVMIIEDFTQAVNQAIQITKKDEILILSPACASFGQHQNYGDRGCHFKRLIKGTNE